MSQTTTTGDQKVVTSETNQEPISSICDAWFLRNGDLQLLVKCSDGSVQTTLVKIANR